MVWGGMVVQRMVDGVTVVHRSSAVHAHESREPSRECESRDAQAASGEPVPAVPLPVFAYRSTYRYTINYNYT